MGFLSDLFRPKQLSCYYCKGRLEEGPSRVLTRKEVDRYICRYCHQIFCTKHLGFKEHGCPKAPNNPDVQSKEPLTGVTLEQQKDMWDQGRKQGFL